MPADADAEEKAECVADAVCCGVKLPRRRKIAEGLSFESLPPAHRQLSMPIAGRQTHIPSSWKPLPGQ
jgi:hypothetical protein